MRDSGPGIYSQEIPAAGGLPRAERALAGLIIVFYFFARYTVFEYLDSLAWWASYGFELVFASAVAFYYRTRLRFGFEPDRSFIQHGAAALAAGLLISLGLHAARVPIPFPLEDGRTVFLALNVAPVLEEGIFRLALWIPMALLLIRRNTSVLLALNAALFSAAHLYSLTVASAEFVPFILIQSLYVIGLGGVCGWWMLRTGSVLYPIVIHYLFNLGFYLAIVF